MKKNAFLLLLIIWVIVHFYFFRKDLNQGLALTGSLCFAILTIKTLNKKTSFFCFILLNFLVPSTLYTFTGFEKIYEMRDQSYIKKLSLEFIKSANKEILNHKIDYYFDYTNIYYFKNFYKHET